MRATLKARNVPVTDTFTFGGANVIPATVSFSVRWVARAPRRRLGRGSSVARTDPAAFLGRFSDASASGRFAGSELGFGFRSRRAADSRRGFAELGSERNGSFLR
jgi:hypothetical protein